MKSKSSFTLWRAGLAALALLGASATRAHAAVSVVASLPELAAITKAVGGNNVSVYSIAKPEQDYHSIEPRPSDVSRIARADLIVRSGLQLDMWMDSLMNAAGNGKLNRGGAGYVDASTDIPRIEIPAESVTGASGDVHPDGNPHYYYDPIYAKYIARNILKGLIRVDGKDADEYRANYKHFNADIDEHMAGWQRALAPFQGQSVVTYHRNYNYFLRRFGIRQYGTMEPKPGIPPSAAHISQLIAQMKRDNVKGLLIESIYPTRYPDLVARQLGIKYEVGPVSVTSQTESGYIDLINQLVNHTRAALS
jgi:zinc/manganese transport system substrate-binding protein